MEINLTYSQRGEKYGRRQVKYRLSTAWKGRWGSWESLQVRKRLCWILWED